MPAAVAAVVSVVSSVAGAVASFAGFATFGALASSVLTNVVVGVGLSYAFQALTGKPKQPSLSDLSSQAQERTRLIRSSVVNHRVIYGTAMVSGPLVFAATTDKGSKKDQYLHLVVPLAAHECQAINSIFFNDVEIQNSDLDSAGNVINGTYEDKARIKKILGSSSQAADPDLVDEVDVWTASHRLLGICYLYVRLEFDPDVYPSGIPNIKALVDGKKLYDPRDSSTVFSHNPALAIRDYLKSTYGLSSSDEELHDASFIAAANICDENVNLAAGGTQKRYTSDGVIDLGSKPIDILEDLLTSCGGVLTYEQGKYKLFVAAATSSSHSINENDLRGPIQVRTKPTKRELFNAVRGVFINPDDSYQPTDFPIRTNSTYEAQDGGEQIVKDVQLPFTTDSIRAQRLAEIVLQRSRQGIAIELPCKLTAIDISVWDVVQVSIAKLGWSNKEFRVVGWSLSEDGGVDLTLQEEADVYGWTPGTDEITIDPAPNTNLPDPFTVLPPSQITLSDVLITLNNGEIATRLNISVVPSTQATVSRYEVEYRKAGETEYRTIGSGAETHYELLGVQDSATYEVRARAISPTGVKSAYVTASTQIVGKTAPPQDVSNFSMNIIGTECHLTWNAVSDVDLDYYRIRYTPLTSGASYDNAVDIVPRVAKPATSVIVPAQTGSYMIKAVDTSGIASQNAAVIASIFDSVKGLNAVETETEHPAFNGSKSGVAAIDDNLILDTSLNFDSATGSFDDALGLFDSGQGNVTNSGTYDFENVVDLGNIYTSRVTGQLTVATLDYVNSFDSALGNFDERAGLFDGDTTTASATNVRLQISTTDDDPAGSPAWGAYRDFVIGDYTARALRFRAILESTDSNQTPQVSQLEVTVDMPDRIEAEGDVSSGTSPSGKVITFTPAFKAVKGLGIAAQNLAQGDYYQITSKSTTGFTITFYNSVGGVVDRTFDYQALGYGYLAS